MTFTIRTGRELPVLPQCQDCAYQQASAGSNLHSIHQLHLDDPNTSHHHCFQALCQPLCSLRSGSDWSDDADLHHVHCGDGPLPPHRLVEGDPLRSGVLDH